MKLNFLDPPASETNAAIVERLVQTRTGGNIRELRVEMNDSGVILSGRAKTYYNKQMATHATLEALGRVSIRNDIEVF